MKKNGKLDESGSFENIISNNYKFQWKNNIEDRNIKIEDIMDLKTIKKTILDFSTNENLTPLWI